MFTLQNLPCRRYQPLLMPFAEHSLDPSLRAQTAAHLSSCPRCRQEVETLRLMSGMLRAESPRGEARVAPDLWNRIEAQITPPAPVSRMAPPTAWQALRVGAPVFAAAVAFAYISTRGSQTQPPVAMVTPMPVAPAADTAPAAALTALVPTPREPVSISKEKGVTPRANKQPSFRFATAKPNSVTDVARTATAPRSDPFAPLSSDDEEATTARLFVVRQRTPSPRLHSPAFRAPLAPRGKNALLEIQPKLNAVAGSVTPTGTPDVPGPVLDGELARVSLPRARVVQVAFEPASELRPLHTWQSADTVNTASMAMPGGFRSVGAREPQVKRRGNRDIALASFSTFPGATPPGDTLANRTVPAAEVSSAANGARRQRELFSFGSR